MSADLYARGQSLLMGLVIAAVLCASWLIVRGGVFDVILGVVLLLAAGRGLYAWLK